MDGVVEETWRDARRSRMLAAAARVFGRTTFEQASMDEIAHEAGVGKPTLYRYFPSKDALFAAVFEHALDDLEVRLDRVLIETTGARERLAGLVREIIPTMRQHLVSLRFLGGTASSAGVSKRRVFRERRSRIARYFGRAIEDGIEAGEMRAVDGTRFGQIAISMLWGATANIQAPDEEIARDVVDLVLNGLLPRVGRPQHPGATRDIDRIDDVGPARASEPVEAPARPCAGPDSSHADGARD